MATMTLKEKCNNYIGYARKRFKPNEKDVIKNIIAILNMLIILAVSLISEYSIHCIIGYYFGIFVLDKIPVSKYIKFYYMFLPMLTIILTISIFDKIFPYRGDNIKIKRKIKLKNINGHK